MKAFSLILIIGFFSSELLARDIVSFSCKGNYTGHDRQGWPITLESGKYYSFTKANEGQMNDIKMVVNLKDRDSVATGRRLGITNDKKYKPTKYKNHYRFDMTKLVDIENFGDFYPDFCEINVKVPKDLVESNVNKATFPTHFHCEHHGGLVMLECDIKTRR